jgi:hypothetical protein
MRKIYKNLLLTFSVLSLILPVCACNRKIANIFPERPNNKFDKDLRDASPEFKQGWHDGCETGMSAGTNTFYKPFYANNVVDGYKMSSSTEYKTAWGNSFWYCYRHDWVKQQGSIWNSIFSGYR